MHLPARFPDAMQLPEQFRDLEPFVDWSLATESARLDKRLSSTMEEIGAFYDAFLPRATAALTYLNDFALDDMPSAEQQLFRLTLSFVEAANAVEVFKQPGVVDGFPPERFVPMPELRPAAMGDGWA